MNGWVAWLNLHMFPHLVWTSKVSPNTIDNPMYRVLSTEEWESSPHLSLPLPPPTPPKSSDFTPKHKEHEISLRFLLLLLISKMSSS